MCGIVGLVSKKGPEELLVLAEKMIKQIMHRGPDGHGLWNGYSSWNDFNIALGHRRLSIIDIAGGHQPMSSQDNQLHLVFNGEIYNFKSLRNLLRDRGHKFITESDTEVILNAYQEFGDECVNYFNGMFAIAIWDDRRKRLFLARDRLGKKPLFYRKEGETLTFASEMKSLYVINGDINIDTNSVWDYLVYRYVPGPATLVSDIIKLPPGHTAVWHQGTFTLKRFYTPPDSQILKKTDNIDELTYQFKNHLEQAVAKRMISDVPLGAFLSGGLDSSVIVALMSKYSKDPINTFSVGFSESSYSELPYAKVVADQFKTNHRELIITEQDMLDNIEKLIWFRDAPISEPSDIPIYLLAKETAKHVKVILTGEGADEVFAGYPKYVYERMGNTYRFLPRLLRETIINYGVRALPYGARRIKTAARAMGIDNPEERMPVWFGMLSWQERRELCTLVNDDISKNALSAISKDNNNSALRRILFFDQMSWLPDNLLERGDRMTMAASIEARMPYLDYELISTISAFPDNYRVRGMKTKWLLREFAKDVLPNNILTRPKVGFRVPVNEWFRGLLRNYLMDHLLSKNSLTADYYDQVILERKILEHMEGKQNHEKLLWGLLNLEIWKRQVQEVCNESC